MIPPDTHFLYIAFLYGNVQVVVCFHEDDDLRDLADVATSFDKRLECKLL